MRVTDHAYAITSPGLFIFEQVPNLRDDWECLGSSYRKHWGQEEKRHRNFPGVLTDQVNTSL